MDVTNIFINQFFLRALAGLILTAIASATVGTLMVSRGMTFLTAEVAHAALGGAALGVFINSLMEVRVDPFLFAIVSGVAFGMLAGYGGKTGSPEKLETAIGISMAISMSIAVLFLGILPSQDIPKVWGYLLGDILLLTLNDIIILSIVVVFTVVIFLFFQREFIYIAMDMEGAEALGYNVTFYHYLSIFISSLAIVVATKAVGSIMIYAVMIIPPAISLMLVKKFILASITSFVMILASGIVGLLISFYVNVVPSGVIGVLISVLYLILAFKRK